MNTVMGLSRRQALRLCGAATAGALVPQAARAQGRRVSVVSTLTTRPPMVADDLRRKVVGCPTQRPDGGVAVLREAEVRNLDVAVKVQEDILGLEIAVDDVERVKIVEGEGDLSGVELGDGVREALPGSLGATGSWRTKNEEAHI